MSAKEFPTTDYSKITQKYYFEYVAKRIIKIAKLQNTNKTILDFGCGQKIFSRLLKNYEIINYDIKPEYTEFESYENLHFDIVIFNHVLMYLYPSEIEKLLDKIKKLNPNCEMVLGISRQNIINRIAMILSFNPLAHKGIRSTYKEQVEIFFKKTKLIEKKSNILAMTDIFYSRFCS